MTASYDAIVLGAGGIGSAAMFHLARRGLRVLGIDRFAPPHAHGSTHGETRIIRKAYFEHADYVPLLERSYALWGELEALADETLLHRVGLVEVGPGGGEVVAGVLRAAADHHLDVEIVAPADLGTRIPGLRVGPDQVVLFERDAGYLRVERCVAAHLAAAARHGAELWPDTAVRSWGRDGDGVVVETSRGAMRAGLLAICGGPWAGPLLADLALPLTVLRKPLYWFETDDPALSPEAGFPVWLVEAALGTFYGFPRLDAFGLKAAEHTGGEVVGDPLTVDRRPRSEEEARLRAFFAAHLPGVTGAVTRHATCFYTMTPDQHFVVDRHPRHRNVALVAGLSGHGFKMATGLGEALADLLLDGRARVPIDLLRLDRPALRGG